jgi:DUF917 family protein
MKRMLKAMAITSFVALVFGAPAAWANCTNPNPAYCQYTEQAPTSTGTKAVGSGGNKQVTKLPTSVQHSIQTQSGSVATATTLERIATNADTGAPAKVTVKKAEKTQVHKALNKVSVDHAKPVRAGFSAVSGGGNGRLIVLVAILGAMTLAAVGLAVARRKGGATRR